MLKTFTLLVTGDYASSLSLEEAVGSTGARRITVFEDDLLWQMPDGRTDVHAARKAHEALRNPPKPRAWADLSEAEQSRTMTTAREYGGGFVRKLADLWNVADATNAAKIGEAFGAMLIESYGPGSGWYDDVA